jgi:phage terminase small subunit
MTPKQQRFVEEYLIDSNATQAAIRAGYSEKTATEQGSRLLTNVKVSEALAAARSRLTMRTEITADWVLARQQELYAAAKADDTAQGFNVAARILHDIGEHIGMYIERHEVSVTDVRMRVMRTLETVRQHAPDQFPAIVRELKPIWQ